MQRDEDAAAPLVVVKLGGAAVTEKTASETLRAAALADACAHVAHVLRRGARVVLVHGAGSFGHQCAARHALSRGGVPGVPRAETARGVAETRRQVLALNAHVCAALASACVVATPLAVFAHVIATADDDADADAERAWCALTASVVRCLRAGIVPVLHGDVALTRDGAVRVVSGDVLVEQLARRLCARAAVFFSGADGVFSRPPGEPGAERLSCIDVSRVDGAWRATMETSVAADDVTGGMAAKLLAAARIAVRTIPVLVRGCAPEPQLVDQLAPLLDARDADDALVAARRQSETHALAAGTWHLAR